MMAQDDVTAGEVLVVRRRIPVPRERVFAAWLDPAAMSRWMCAGKVTQARVQLDARVGGAYSIVMVHDGADHEHRGVYLAIEPPSLLSFTWISHSTLERTTVVTIEFQERDNGAATELVLTHRGLPPSQVEAHRGGWEALLGSLGGLLGASSGAGDLPAS